MKLNWKMPVLLLAAGGAVAFVAINEPARERALGLWSRALGQVRAAEVPQPATPVDSGPKLPPGVVSLTTTQKTALGVATAEVLAQTDPVKIPVNGATSYDLDSQKAIHPKFTAAVQKVYITLGQSINPGDPLVDVFSAELAKAKIDWEMKKAQAELDRRELERNKKLFENKPPSISEREYLAAQNTEKQSRQAMESAEDILQVYGLTHADIESIKDESGDQKAKMTMKAPGAGIIVKRDVVVGNVYQIDDILLNVTPLDHFWVDGSIYPRDAGRVQLGQDWEIYLPFLDETIRTKVTSVSSSIDDRTKTYRIRATIPNVNGRMKADMLVSGTLEIPAFTKGRISVPRLALVSTDGADYVFVSQGGDPERFKRCKVRVIQENSDRVIMVGDDTLKPGARVATRGSLMLAQIFEDSTVSETGEAQ